MADTPEPMEGNEQPKTFTQEELNRIVAERVARVKHELPPDYEELQRKAAAYDKAEDEKKSELEKALESANAWKAKAEKMEAEKAHATAVHEHAKAYGVDATILDRMAGDVEENAKFLASTMQAAPKYPQIPDNGVPAGAAVTAPKPMPNVF